MKYWEKLSRIIFKYLGRKYLQSFQVHSLENVLRDGLKLVDSQTLSEMKGFVQKQQTVQGGFADKAGKCDLYYSLFGCFVAEALDMPEVLASLKRYVRNTCDSQTLSGVYLYCAAILFAKLIGRETLPGQLEHQLKAGLTETDTSRHGYDYFLNLLTFYYLEDYPGLYRIGRMIDSQELAEGLPCTVTAAHLVLRQSFGRKIEDSEQRLRTFYRQDGSFSALHRAPVGDMLSTSVALYSLRFAGSDIRLLKPDCLGYIDSLYSEGGFCATVFDPDPDMEYTFYGLLALGSLSN